MSKTRFTLGDLLMWVALAALVAALLAAMFGDGSRTGLARKLAVSADGSTAAALFSDGTVRIWNTADGKLAAPATKAPGAWDLALSDNGKLLALGRPTDPVGQFRVVVYGVDLSEVHTGKRLRTFPGQPGCEVILAPGSGRIVLSDHSGSVDLYEAPLERAKGIRLASPPVSGSPNSWNAPVFSPDCQLLAVRNGSDEIVVFDIASRQIQAKLNTSDNGMGGIAFSPDGRKLVALSPTLSSEFDVVPLKSIIEFEAPHKTGSAWDFSAAKRREHKMGDRGCLKW